MGIRAQHLPAEKRRTAAVEAVVFLAGSQNPASITTSAIANHMQLSHAALFRHFPTKDDLWEAVMSWVAEFLLARIDRAAQDIESPLAAMEAVFMSHIDFVLDHPGVPRIIFGELQRCDDTRTRQITHELVQRYAEKIRSHIERGKRIGEIASDVDTRASALLFIGTIQGLVMQSMLSGDIRRIRQDAPGVYALYQRSLRCAP